MLTAESRWTRLQSKRHAVLERARDCAALTIPALVPPEGHDDNNVLPTPYQSLGARGVNNVASKLLMSLFPPAHRSCVCRSTRRRRRCLATPPRKSKTSSRNTRS
jgi:hypothetical protein